MKIHQDILREIKKRKIVTSSEIAEEFNLSWNTAQRYLLELVIEKKIENIKKSGVNLWVMK